MNQTSNDIEVRVDQSQPEYMENSEDHSNKQLVPSLNREYVNLIQFLRSGEFNDAVIRSADGVQFPVHRVLLAGQSSYFSALFTATSGHESRTITYDLWDVDGSTLRCLIGWCYGHRPIDCGEEIEKLMITSDKYDIGRLTKHCEKMLINRLDNLNVVRFYVLSETYYFGKLNSVCGEYIVTQFEKLALLEPNELASLNVDQFTRFLQMDEINVLFEELLFDTACYWMTAIPSRSMLYPQVLSDVRYGLMSVDYLNTMVKPNALVRSNPMIRELVDEITNFLIDLQINSASPVEFRKRKVSLAHKEVKIGKDLLRFFRSRHLHKAILVMNGWSEGSVSGSFEIYDDKNDQWTMITHSPLARAYHGAVCRDGSIYIVGGYDGIEYFNSCLEFNINTREYRPFPPMHTKRCYVSVVFLDNKMYAIGGHNGNHREFSCECFDFETFRWQMVAPMQFPRSDATASVLDGKIYVCGGFNGTQCVSSCERYCPNTNTWTVLPSMQNLRSGLRSVVAFGKLYVLGGYNGNQRLKTGERFDEDRERWVPISSMFTTRSNFSCLELHGMIYAIGGFDGRATTGLVERYFPTRNEWEELNGMTLTRSATTACIIEGHEVIQTYLSIQDSYQNGEENVG